MNGFFKIGSPFIVLAIKDQRFEFLLDTGFNGYLMLPLLSIRNLGIKQVGISFYITASGERASTFVYLAKLLVFDREIEIPVLATSTSFCLAGMELFHDCRIVIERSKDIVEVSKSH